jgi:hypothetical protein
MSRAVLLAGRPQLQAKVADAAANLAQGDSDEEDLAMELVGRLAGT